MRTKLYLIFTCILFATACKKSDYLPVPGNKIDIYIAGNKEGVHTPFVLKNGELNLIEVNGIDRENVELIDFKIANGKFYTGLKFKTLGPNLSMGAYTIDQQVKYIPSVNGYSLGHFTIYNNDVYLTSIGSDGTQQKVNIYKNGVINKTYNFQDYPYSFAIYGKDHYFRLSQRNAYIKNGQLVELPLEGDLVVTTDLFVNQKNVYVSGYQVANTNERPTFLSSYWKNGVLYNTPSDFWFKSVYKIIEDKNNLYLLTEESNYSSYGVTNIFYYKNGSKHELPLNGHTAVAHDMQVYKDDLYMLISVIESQGHMWKVFKNSQLIASYPFDEYFYYQRFKLQIAPRS